ncbi:hypothetical protein QQF64_014063 [Cirrhinus molitorella]|uniref:RRM domain-containing protein n=1 Tax=Cirrhinus molitorella TaxID=172907 RepID=A0ABR3LWJ0_9TELE
MYSAIVSSTQRFAMDQQLSGKIRPSETVEMATSKDSGEVKCERDQSGPLFVGNLHPNVTESVLLSTFLPFGPICFVQVCRNKATNLSRGFGFVTFEHRHNAENALDTLIFSELLGKQMRIMWAQHDSTLRKSGIGNIMITGLARDIDDLALYDTFSCFGEVLSSRVVCDSNGEPKGYGFVHYASLEAAELAIKKLDGMLLNDHLVSISHYKPYKKRQADQNVNSECCEKKNNSICDKPAIVSSTQRFALDQELTDKNLDSEMNKMTTSCNSDEVKVERDQSGPLFVGNLHPNVTEQVLLSIFLPFGPICFVQVCREKATNLSRGFGFVTFEHRHNAENARDTLIFSELLGKQMRIMWAQYDSTLRKSGIGNIMITGLARDIDDLALYDTFSCFGEVLSSRVVCDSNGEPKGYGFVHYASLEAAELAIGKLDGMLLNDNLVSISHYKPYKKRQADQNANSKCYEKKDNSICDKPAIVSSTHGLALEQELSNTNLIAETDKMTTSQDSGEVQVERDQSGPLFVGNLHPNVTEQVLLSTFLQFGPICFVKVCRDKATNLSHEFDFVTFAHRYNTENAQDTLIFSELLGKQMCIMWAQHDSTLRKSGIGNIMIKGLARGIDDLALYNTFSCSGEVLSSRVVCDSNGEPKSYGFVHYASLEAAELAIGKLDGMLLHYHLVSTIHYKPYKKRQADQNANSKCCEKKNNSICDKPAIVSSTHGLALEQELSSKNLIAETVKMTTSYDSGEVQVERDQSGPLFVGSLHPNVTEQVLLSTFLQFGPICFVKVCRDKATNLSRGFGFVTFAHRHNAENARDTLIFSELLGKPMHIMWAQDDSTLRKSGNGNIMTKGLTRDIDDLAIYDTFSCFGEVLSSRVVCDSNGEPKGYGFVHYASLEAAELAIGKLDGMLLNDHLVSIIDYKPYKKCQADQNLDSKCCEKKNNSICDKPAIVSSTHGLALEQELSSKNLIEETVKMTTSQDSGEVQVERDQLGPLFVGNLHPDVTEQVLLSTFLQFGPICFVRVCRDKATNLSRGFGFVTFAHRHNAENARDTLIFSELLGKPMRIMLAQHDSTLRKSRIGNIMIKGLARDIDDLALYNTFSCFGEVLSSRVVCDSNGEPKGYGFVHYASLEAAELAIEKLDGMLLNDHQVSISSHKPYKEQQVDKNANFKSCRKKDYSLHVSNLPYKLDSDHLCSLFSAFGNVNSAKVIMNNRRSRGYGFVSYSSINNAITAVSLMNGYIVGNRPLKVALSHSVYKNEVESQQITKKSYTYK